ncbi:alpha/beta fold hydrolase [Streptomyces sp. XH2]|uniref:alpha/beta fold hydrolase n=1 Tax=Streptomyces sp. XH2 TaxID=3412483 RepID=UPI003C7E0EFA
MTGRHPSSLPLARAGAHDHRITWSPADFPCRTVVPDGPAGAADPLLVLGGGLQNRHSWARFERRTASRFPLVIPDLPAARTPGQDVPSLDWDDLTDAALRVMDQLRIRRFAVLGVSSGYPIGYRLAQRHPDRVTRLMLFGASPRPAPRLAKLIGEGLRREAGRRAPASSAEDAPARLRAAEELVGVLTNPEAAERHLLIRAAGRVVLDQLAASPCDPLVRYVHDRGFLLLRDPLPPGGIHGVPSLVGVGEFDTATTVADNRAVASTISRATFVVMENADHLLHMERDADFAALVTLFLGGRPLSALRQCTVEAMP